MAIVLNGSTNVITPTASVQPTGAILQVVSAQKTDTFSMSTETWADITGLTVTLTPAAASSKMLCRYTVVAGTNQNYFVHFALARVISGTETQVIHVGDQGSSNCARASSTENHHQTYGTTTSSTEFLDSPNTTSAVTYKVKMASGDETADVYIGRPIDASNEFSRARHPSSITVMEIAG